MVQSSTVEDYLKAIASLHLSKATTDRPVALGAIAKRLGVTPGTVTTMMKHLAGKGLVEYLPRRGVKLTGEGRSQAMGVLRRHRLIELFLVEIMQLDWADVHVEAERLEHALSDRLLERIDEMLRHPTRDPHGDPIPSAQGKLPIATVKPLNEATPGPLQIVRITDDSAQFLEWVSTRNLKPGTTIHLTDHDPIAKTMTVKHPRKRNSQFHIAEEPAGKIMVTAE